MCAMRAYVVLGEAQKLLWDEYGMYFDGTYTVTYAVSFFIHSRSRCVVYAFKPNI